MAYSLCARVVYPVDSPPIDRGVVTIDGERIIAINRSAPGGEVVDLGDFALLPGLVNAHTHLEFSYLSRPLGRPGIALVDWIRLVLAERARTSGNASGAIGSGLAESLRHGVTAVCDIIASRGGDPLAASDGHNASLVDQIDVRAFVEVIGFSRARADSALAATAQHLDALQSRAALRLGVSPHAPYTVSPALLEKLVALANERSLPVAMHLAESEEELTFLSSGAGPFQQLLEERSMWDAEAVPRGNRPADYLRMLAQAPRALVIHGNYLDDEERAFLAAHRHRMSLVYCPRTHAYFGHLPYPLTEILNAGVHVALGTDSRASNPDLSLFAEMRCIARTYPEIDPHMVLRLGTLSGAQALGRDDELGSITPGKRANLVAVPLPQDATARAGELLQAVLAADTQPTDVWLRGLKVI